MSYCPSPKASLARETCLIQDHTFLLRQTKPQNFLIYSSSCQSKGHASSRIPCGAHSISPSVPSCFFPFPSTMLISKAPIEKHSACWSPSQSLLPRGLHYNSQGTVPVLRCSLSHVWWYFHPQGLHLWDSSSTQPYPSSTPSTWSSKTLTQQVSPLSKILSTQWFSQPKNWNPVNSQWKKKIGSTFLHIWRQFFPIPIRHLAWPRHRALSWTWNCITHYRSAPDSWPSLGENLLFPFLLEKDQKDVTHRGKTGALKSSLWSNFLQIDF